ncbi:endonuclease Q family protein [Methanocalculus sp.]|uniref:endonuclease Q family protein n=1 Tax=Methanocalculus sp. TaxID=2004547 RepID=UPI00271AA85D|nr:PHP-associated domain-containing protein [Methanocalculus sp.]MDO8842020.1 PHP-associated domain-containing protein [Methanocalculus sp.]
MAQVTADLHIHSCFSMATSKDMLPDRILSGCRTKGIGAIGSGDALHPEWRRMWGEVEDDHGMILLPTAEVEDQDRVHHLIAAETFDSFVMMQEMFTPHCSHLKTSGRPHIRLNGEGIAKIVHEAGGLIGPAHAFTPWRSIYAAFSSLAECYGDEEVSFLELGLSADSRDGAGISELAGIPFLTNSDAHSPVPEKLGRECTILDLNTMDVTSLLSAIRDGRILMNIGFFPEEGKYNRTACTRCFHQYTLEEAIDLKWRCPLDKGRIKKGVSDRARELSGTRVTERPPYLHIIPLAEIIANRLGTCSPRTKKCSALYDELIAQFGDELSILITVSAEEIRSVHPGVADAIAAFREGRVTLHPGGGGQYGTFSV